MEPQIGFCTTPDGARIAYTTLGHGSALVIPPSYFIVLNAYKSVPEVRHYLNRLALYHTVVIYDQRGAGLSDRNRAVFTLESELADLETVINHLKLDKVILSAASQAGPIAIAYAAKYPERVTHLVLYGTYANYGKFLSEEIKTSLISLIRQPHNWVGTRTVASIMTPQININELELFVNLQRESVTPEVNARLIEMQFELDVTNLCSSVKTPTLVMHRKGDKFILFKAGLELASLIPNARFVPLEGNEHYSFLGDVETGLRNTFQFLGDPVPDKSADNAGKTESLSNPPEPKTEQKKGNWLRMSNPLVKILITILASVIAGVILLLIKSLFP
ncbi:MAG: alpha/beta hydrolase [Dehalococcoidia bacterium]